MLDENLYTDTNQNDPCPKFGTQIDALTEKYAYQASDDGEHERHETDDEHWVEDASPSGHAGEGKRDADCQGVDAGSYS